MLAKASIAVDLAPEQGEQQDHGKRNAQEPQEGASAKCHCPLLRCTHLHIENSRRQWRFRRLGTGVSAARWIKIIAGGASSWPRAPYLMPFLAGPGLPYWQAFSLRWWSRYC